MSEGQRYDLGDKPEPTKTCGTCMYFGNIQEVYNDETFDDEPTTYHTCDRIDMDKSYPAKQQALVDDGSDYYAVLLVEDDFGCVLWRSK